MKKSDITIQLSAEVTDKLAAIASSQNIEVEQLISVFIDDGVKKTLPKTMRKNFFNYMKELLHSHKVPTVAVNEFPEKFTY